MAYDVKTKKPWSSKLVLGLVVIIAIILVVFAAITIPAVGAGLFGLGALIVGGFLGFLSWMATGQVVVAVIGITVLAFIVYYRKQIFTRKRTIIQSPLASSMATPYMSNIPTNVMQGVLPQSASPQVTQELVTEVKPAQ